MPESIISEADMPEYLKWLDRNKGSFPEGTSDDKAMKFFLAERSRIRQRENERLMSKQAQEIESEAEANEREREARAISALAEPNPMNRFIEAYKLSHIGHYQIVRAIVYAECLKSSGTTKGIQPYVTGQRGSGKSHGVRTSVHLLPNDGKFIGTLSDKSLYYKNPEPKTTFYLDDVDLSENLISLLKRKQTEFQQRTIYGTVIDRKWTEIAINPRMVFILTSVAPQGGNQISDRALLIDIKNEKTDDDEFLRFEQQRRIDGRPEFPECPEVFLCRDMLAHIRKNEFNVIMPKVDFAYAHDRRLVGQCYDLMEGSAILNYRNREHHKDERGVIHVKATPEDLANGLDFDMFKLSDPEVDDRLLKSEVAFDKKVQALLNGKQERSFTQKELAELTGTNETTLRKYLYGHGKNYDSCTEGDGLCGKTKWYSVDKQKDTITDAVKNFVTVRSHTYKENIERGFAWIS